MCRKGNFKRTNHLSSDVGLPGGCGRNQRVETYPARSDRSFGRAGVKTHELI